MGSNYNKASKPPAAARLSQEAEKGGGGEAAELAAAKNLFLVADDDGRRRTTRKRSRRRQKDGGDDAGGGGVDGRGVTPKDSGISAGSSDYAASSIVQSPEDDELNEELEKAKRYVRYSSGSCMQMTLDSGRRKGKVN